MESTGQCPPVTTTRLKPLRQRLNRTMMNIIESGHVTIETYSTCQSNSSQVAKEVFCISPDGQQVEVYQNTEGVMVVDGCPVSCQPCRVFSYPDLPTKQWKKYQHAYKFVDLVKSRTPKVVLVTESARCKLMENLPVADFEANFCDGVKILLSKSRVTITDQDACSLTLDADSVSSCISSSTWAMVEYVQHCRAQCLHIEKLVTAIQEQFGASQLFPITVGTNSQPFVSSCDQLTINTSKTPDFTGSGETWERGDSASLQTNSQLPQHTVTSQLETDTATSQLETVLENALSPPSQHKDAVHDKRSHGYCVSHGCELTEVKKTSNSRELLTRPAAGTISPHVFSQWLFAEEGSTSLEAEVGNLLLSDSVRLDSLSSSNSSSSMKSLSAVTTAQKSKHIPGEGFQSSTAENEQTDIQQSKNSLDLTPNFPSSVEDKLQCQSAQRKLLATESSLLQDYSTPSSYSAPSESKQVSKICDNTVPYSPVCQTVSTLNSSGKKSFDICNKNVPESEETQFCDSFVTPKKCLGLNPAQLHCHSVGAIEDHHRAKGTKLSLSLGAVVDDRELQNVRRNLFSDHVLEEPKVSPLPVASSHSWRQGLVAVRPNLSLELSNYSDLEEPALLQTNQSKFHVWDLSSVPGSSGSSTEQNQTGSCGVRASLAETEDVTSMLASDNHTSHCPRVSQMSSTSCAVEMSACSNMSKQALPSQVSLSPKKHGMMRKVVVLNHKTSTMKMDGNSVNNSQVTQHSDKMSTDCYHHSQHTSPQTYSASQNMSMKNIVANVSLTNNSGSLNTDNSRTLSRENLNHSKSDPGSYTRTAITTNLPRSPQKEFLMPSSSHGDRYGLDLILPSHVGNSLDMSLSSYHSDSPSSSPSSGCDPIRQVFVPYTGWASFYATGAVWILYNDGTQLGVKSTEAAMIYIDQDGSQRKYKNSDVVPEIVKLKLERLPKVIDLLMGKPTLTSSGREL